VRLFRKVTAQFYVKLAWTPCSKIAGPSFVVQVILDFKFLLASYGYFNIEQNLCFPSPYCMSL
jgi:hypothetical protein